jgi:hypothetical protein
VPPARYWRIGGTGVLPPVPDFSLAYFLKVWYLDIFLEAKKLGQIGIKTNNILGASRVKFLNHFR